MTHAKQCLAVLFTFLLACSSGIAIGDSDFMRVDCSLGESIAQALGKKKADRALTVVVRGTCTEAVAITGDDVALIGEGGTVMGPIVIRGARRALIRNLTVTNAGGDGIVVSDNAAANVEDSTVEFNGEEGILVRNGGQANLRRNILRNNGVASSPDTGRGLQVTHNGSAHAENNTIVNNRSDGIGVYNGSYARLVANTIEGNGRLALGEAGVQVNRSRVRAHGNIIRSNTGGAAVIVTNHADYRTGSFLSDADFPDNEFAFEQIQHATGSGHTALEISNASYGDFRQVDITGSVNVGPMSMLQIRGDDVGPNLRCSTVNYTGGFFSVSGRNGLARLRATNVTPPAVGLGMGNAQLDGPVTCPTP
jgi:hypothetical protein